MKLGGMFIRSVMVEAGKTISKNLHWVTFFLPIYSKL